MRNRTANTLSRARAYVTLTCFGLVIILLWPRSLSAQQAPAKANPDYLHGLSDSFQSLVRRVSPSVVQIRVERYGPVQEGGRGETALIGKQHVTGSGFVFDPDGYIITNAHVVAGAERVRVVLSPASSGSPRAVLRSTTRAVDAKIIGQDQDLDIALLKIDATGLPALPLGDYDQLRQGQIVLAFGSPEGLENSVSMGVVSAVARQANPDRPMIYIQTDAPINPGNSGGPLVDVDGSVVGVNTFILTASGGSEGLGFAIPSPVIKFAYPQLKQFGHVHRGQIGAAAQAITPVMASALGLPQDHGVIVCDVFPDGPADSAGLKVQDVVLSVDGRPIETLPQFQAFLFLRTKGESLKVEVLRGSERLTLQIPVIPRQDELDRIVDLVDAEKNIVPQLGILGLQIDEKISKLLPGLRFASGVMVAALTATTTSQGTGLQPGDVIHAFNRIPIVSIEALQSSVQATKPGSPVVLQVERDGKLQYVAFEWE
jgi:serine protease Do